MAFIRAAQAVGLSLEEIGAAMDTLPLGRTPTKADWHRLSRGWRSRLDHQISRLERLRDDLDGCIGCGCLSLRSCALYNPHDTLVGSGPGGGPAGAVIPQSMVTHRTMSTGRSRASTSGYVCSTA